MANKTFTIKIPESMHTRLRELSKHFNLGQNYVLIALISIADQRDDVLIDAIERVRRTRPQNLSAEDQISATVQSMSSTEKSAMRERLGL